MSTGTVRLHGGLAGKRALITGATQGLGRSMAMTFAREGAHVAVHGPALVETESTVRAISESGGRACAVAADLLVMSSIRPMIDSAVAQLGGIDILINNAGIAPTVKVSEMEETFWDKMLDVDLKAPFLASKFALETMIKNRDGGRIIFISSTAAKTADPTYAAYAAAKAGILGFARCLATEVGPYGVTVNSICPGWIDTPLSRKPIKEWAQKKGVTFEQLWQETMANTNMLKTVLTPEDISECALYLASERGRHITAQAINVCGGLTYW